MPGFDSLRVPLAPVEVGDRSYKRRTISSETLPLPAADTNSAINPTGTEIVIRAVPSAYFLGLPINGEHTSLYR